MQSEPHWELMAQRLWNFLRLLPGLKYPYDLGEKPQATLADYVPPPGYWTIDYERERQFFTSMPPREFQAVYATLIQRAS